MKPDYIIENIKKAISQRNPPVVSLVAMHSKDPYKILISTLLSLRTKDEVTLKASFKLFKEAPNIEKLYALEEKKIAKLIFPVGFYNIKAKNLKKIAKILIEKHGGKIPNSIDKLLSLPGVGRKTANLVLSEAFRKPAICVDTHVHRISNRLGIVSTNNPLATELALQKFFPKQLWLQVNKNFVAFGQEICRPVSPFCKRCPLNKNCPKIGVEKHR